MKKLIVIFAMALMSQMVKGQEDITILYAMEILDVHKVLLKTATEYPYIYDYTHPTIIKKTNGKDTATFNLLTFTKCFYAPFYE